MTEPADFWQNISRFPDGARLKITVSYVSRDGSVSAISASLDNDEYAKVVLGACFSRDLSAAGQNVENQEPNRE